MSEDTLPDGCEGCAFGLNSDLSANHSCHQLRVNPPLHITSGVRGGGGLVGARHPFEGGIHGPGLQELFEEMGVGGEWSAVACREGGRGCNGLGGM